VIASLEDFHFFVVGPVDEPVFVVNTARPVAGQITFQGFRLSYPREWVALDLLRRGTLAATGDSSDSDAVWESYVS
jgi:hypothetical protein